MSGPKIRGNGGDEFRRGKNVTEVETLRERKKAPEHIHKLLLANTF